MRNLPGFARFLPVAALCHGQSINISGLARDAGVARTTVEGYVQILEDTLLARRLPAYTARLRVRERKHPKLYWVDPGVARAAKTVHGVGGPLYPEERGALLEGYIHTLLLTYMAERELAEEITYLSPAGSRQTEVDFLLSRNSEHCARRSRPQRASSRSTSPGCAQSPPARAQTASARAPRRAARKNRGRNRALADRHPARGTTNKQPMAMTISSRYHWLAQTPDHAS